MPPLLSLNLQVQVLGHLREWGGWRTDDNARTLLSCCLVCKAWCQVCQRKLLRVEEVHIGDHRQLENFVGLLSSSAVNPIGTYVTQLSLYGNMCQIAPFYLATKLSSLRRLAIKYSIDRSSLIMHLKLFRTVTELKLESVTFQSFWDFCHLVVTLPALSILRLGNVRLLNSESSPFGTPDGRVPSFFNLPRNLHYLSIAFPSRNWNWNPLWIWATPSRTRHRPFLTRHDADVIWALVWSVGQCGDIFKWLFDEDHHQGEYCLLSFYQGVNGRATL